MKDIITVTILDDGTIKTETDKISPASHLNAENFLKECFRMAGGKTTIEFKKGAHIHEHAHTHEHGHEHTHQH